MPYLIVDKRNISLEYEADCIIIRNEESRQCVPISRISQLICMHNTVLTTQLMGQLQERGIDLIVINNRFQSRSYALIADQQKTVARRCQQYEWQKDEQICLTLAKAVCHNKMLRLYRLANTQQPDMASTIKSAAHTIKIAPNLAALRGVEGSLQRKAFELLRLQLAPKYEFKSRVRRPPTDPVNALLSLTYMMLHYEAVRACQRFGLDPYLGFYHRLTHARYSLACDLMEPLRPHAEAFVVKLLLHGILNKSAFSHGRHGCLLGKEGRQTYYEHYAEFLTVQRRALLANTRWLARRIDQSLQ
ncbi:MAG: CRISPR-associated Cas1 family protein [Idiomarina sp. T82-3]|uniref:CRISPR-associated endonuclease Cas1 n=1 Tax=Idiomarina TaxID=135575 RepID=UPI0007964C3E|nr:CRISPR-associated endonuclease Cas1 [Idiomarina sp. T82-3]KXS36238.1 MAG: CRISPR-associated Cas1 family protein [Idiomarina sp. T82-3]